VTLLYPLVLPQHNCDSVVFIGLTAEQLWLCCIHWSYCSTTVTLLYPLALL